MQVQLVGLVGRTMHMPGTGLDPCLVCVAGIVAVSPVDQRLGALLEDLERVNLRGDGIRLGNSSVVMARMSPTEAQYLAICVIC